MWPVRKSCPGRASLCTLLLLLLWQPAAADSQFYRDDDGRVLEMAISDQIRSPQREAVGNWLYFLADALRQVYGHWPRDRWRIQVEAVSGNSDDPIPWAQVRRGDVDTVEFYIIHKVGEDALRNTWTGYHELAHLLIPYRGWGDAWFSEGLASYYQNLMQARVGVLSEQQMWQKLYEGFQRGRQDSRFDGQPLARVSAQLREAGGFMRVYWSGAWYFLQADMRLRQQSDGTLTLDRALEALNRCCAQDALSVPEIVERLDKANDTNIFTPLYYELLQSTRQPAFEPLFEQLDITATADTVVLGNGSPESALRQQISRGPL